MSARSSLRVALAISLMAMLALAPDLGRASLPTFGVPVRAGLTGSEPGIDIAADGTIFVNAPSGLGLQSALARSTDGGAKYTRLSFPNPYNRFPGGGDSDVTLGAGGRVYFLDLWAGSNSIIASDDNGTTWTRGTPFTTLPLTDRQWIEVGARSPAGTDTVYVAYQIIQQPSSLVLSRSRDGGMLWDHHTLPSGTVDSLPGQIVADGDFIAVSYIPQGTGTLRVALSKDAGETWTQSVVEDSGDVAQQIFSGAGLALDGAHLYASYVNRRTNTISVVHSKDRGVTWDDAKTVSSPALTATFPWVAARGGKAAVAWYSADRSGAPSAMPAEAEWSVLYTETLDFADTFTPPVTAAPRVKLGPICTSGLSCTANRELGDFLQLAINAGQRSLISFVKATGPGVHVVRQT